MNTDSKKHKAAKQWDKYSRDGFQYAETVEAWQRRRNGRKSKSRGWSSQISGSSSSRRSSSISRRRRRRRGRVRGDTADRWQESERLSVIIRTEGPLLDHHEPTHRYRVTGRNTHTLGNRSKDKHTQRVVFPNGGRKHVNCKSRGERGQERQEGGVGRVGVERGRVGRVEVGGEGQVGSWNDCCLRKTFFLNDYFLRTATMKSTIQTYMNIHSDHFFTWQFGSVYFKRKTKRNFI